MTSELWIRNPGHCIREAKRAGESLIAFDEGYLMKRKIDPISFLNLYYGEHSDWQLMVFREHGTSHFVSSDTENPVGVYPTWNAMVDPMNMLEDWCANPLGEDQQICLDKSLPGTTRPIYGQDHRIIIHNIPNIRSALAKTLLTTLFEMQNDYDVWFFIHGIYSFMPLINLDFHSFDIEPRSAAAHKKVWLPNGREVEIVDGYHRHKKWIQLLGFDRGDMNDPATRCVFNIKAARWAIENGTEPTSFATKPSSEDDRPDHTVSDVNFQRPTNNRTQLAIARTQPGDKVECSVCSLADSCKYYREGSVCTLPGSEMSELAQMFATTDSATILKGMSQLTAMSAARAERAMAFEADFGLDPEVTKMLKQTFEFAERYAKLNDPMLRASVNFNRNTDGPESPGAIEAGQAYVEQLDANQAAKLAIAHFEKQGVKQEDITLDMIKAFIAGLASAPVAAIEA